jgi:Iron-containing redox enzyme
MRLALIEPTLSAASLRILQHPSPAELYPAYLAGMHGISRAAVPLLEAALRRCEAPSPDDPINAELVSYYRRHIPEERGHDEWVLEDLEVLGLARADLLDRIPSPATAALVGSQYYWIEHVHPVALLGYLAIMETNPPSREAVTGLMEATGLPPDAFRSMRIHAQLDIKHREDLYYAIDRMSFSPWQQRLIVMSALRTAELLAEVLIELVDDFDREAATAAPASLP